MAPENPHALDSCHYVIFEGWKRYEVANHLGNVLAVITDRKRGRASSGTAIQWYEADVLSAQQYYPFGMLMPGNASATLRRQYSLNSYDHRYGFNGKEGDDEVKGDDNQVDFGARPYDPRSGRWLSVDPMEQDYPDISPYTFVANSPIMFVDPDGRYILPANMALKYSKLAGYLQNGIGTLLQNENIRSGLRLIGGFSEEQINNDLTKYGEGIIINLQQLDNDETDHPQGLEKNGDQWVHRGEINIDETLAQQLQDASSPEEEAAALLGIVSTILHESIHAGQNGYGEGGSSKADGAFSKEDFYNERTGGIDYKYLFNGKYVGDTRESGIAFENAVWDFGGALWQHKDNLRGMKQGEQGKKDQRMRYVLNEYFGNADALPKSSNK